MVDSAEAAVQPEVLTELVPMPDGRQLGVCQWGDLDGNVLFLLHGTPGSRFLRHPGSGYIDHQLRVITYDRPGYGVSTRVPGHRVADAAAEIRRIADYFGLDRFGVAGVSGGGPRALAAAALLPDRVTRCATIVSIAPFTAEDLDFYAAMDDESRSEWQAAREDGEAMDIQCSEVVEWVRAGLPELTLDDDSSAMLQQAFTEALRQGVDGYRDDRTTLMRDWEFSLADVRVPTRMMVGLEDSSIPRSHWAWLAAHVPDSTLVPVPGNHFGPRDEPEMQLIAWTGAHP